MRVHIALAAFMLQVGGCVRPPPPAMPPQSTEPFTKEGALAGAALVLDVRTPEEYAEGHLPRAVLIPIATLETRIREVDDALDDKTKKVVVYCASGRRAEQAKNVLEAHGYTNVVNGGGYEALR